MRLDIPTAQQILAARSELFELSFEMANDFFGATWLASHVRLVELQPDIDINLPMLLAYVFTRNPAEEYPIDEWLPNTVFIETDSDELAGMIAQAASDLGEAEDRFNEGLSAALERLTECDAKQVWKIEGVLGRPEPRLPYEYGLTHQLFWVGTGRFYYLEIHHES